MSSDGFRLLQGDVACWSQSQIISYSLAVSTNSYGESIWLITESYSLKAVLVIVLVNMLWLHKESCLLLAMFIIVLANTYCSCYLWKERICCSYCSPINHVFYPKDDWLIMSFCFEVASCSCTYLTRSVLVGCSLSTMYPYSYYTCTFFCNSTLFAPVDVTINCFMYK